MRDVKDPEVRRAEIMEAALHLFAKKGYLNTTTQDIIDEVRISRGLLYYHFKNKEDILYCLVERYTEPLLQRLSAIAHDGTLLAIDKVRLFIEASLISPDDITSDRIELQKSVDLEQNRYMLDRFSHRFASTVTTYFAHMIEQGISEGVFQVSHPLETATFLMTGYVFVSNDMKASYSDLDVQEPSLYIAAFKELLESVLKTTIFDK